MMFPEVSTCFVWAIVLLAIQTSVSAGQFAKHCVESWSTWLKRISRSFVQPMNT